MWDDSRIWVALYSAICSALISTGGLLATVKFHGDRIKKLEGRKYLPAEEAAFRKVTESQFEAIYRILESTQRQQDDRAARLEKRMDELFKLILERRTAANAGD